MKRKQIVIAVSAVVLAVTGIFATKASFKFHPGTNYYYKNAQGVCQTSTPIKCTDFNTGLGECRAGTLYTNSNCTTEATIDLYVPNTAN